MLIVVGGVVLRALRRSVASALGSAQQGQPLGWRFFFHDQMILFIKYLHQDGR